MMKILLSLIIALGLVACKNSENQIQTEIKQITETPKEEVKSLDDVEFFFKEYKSFIIHINSHCTKNSCVYIKKEEALRHDSWLCGKCISPELAREIMNR
jgi:Tfp pilus assembly protein PilP